MLWDACVPMCVCVCSLQVDRISIKSTYHRIVFVSPPMTAWSDALVKWGCCFPRYDDDHHKRMIIIIPRRASETASSEGGPSQPLVQVLALPLSALVVEVVR